MKVLMITGSYPPIKCGVGDYTHELVKSISKKAEVVVLTSTDATTTATNGITVKNVVKKWSGLHLIKTILKEIKNGKYDVVHFQFPTSKYKSSSIANYIILPILLRLKKIKLVYTIHEYSNNSRISKLVRIPAILSANKIVIVDDLFEKELLKKFKRRKEKFRYINIGVNVDKSNETEEEIRALRKSLQSSDEKLLAHFGFINSAKRLDLIFKAMALLKKENKLNSKLILMGDFNSERCGKETFDELNKIIEENDLSKNIHVTGYIEGSVGKYFRASDCALMLFANGVSVRNGSILAAQQEGVKIFTSKPAREINVFGEQFSYVENTIESVAQAILFVQENEKQVFATDGIFSWDNIAEKHLLLYKELTKKRDKK